MSEDSGTTAIPWRVHQLELELRNLKRQVDSKVSKDAFRERREEIEKQLARVERELAQLEATTGVELKALRESLATIARQWETDKLDKTTADLTAQKREILQQALQNREKFWRTMTIIISVAALLWNVLSRIWFP